MRKLRSHWLIFSSEGKLSRLQNLGEFAVNRVRDVFIRQNTVLDVIDRGENKKCFIFRKEKKNMYGLGIMTNMLVAKNIFFLYIEQGNWSIGASCEQGKVFIDATASNWLSH